MYTHRVTYTYWHSHISNTITKQRFIFLDTYDVLSFDVCTFQEELLDNVHVTTASSDDQRSISLLTVHSEKSLKHKTQTVTAMYIHGVTYTYWHTHIIITIAERRSVFSIYIRCPSLRYLHLPRGARWQYPHDHWRQRRSEESFHTDSAQWVINETQHTDSYWYIYAHSVTYTYWHTHTFNTFTESDTRIRMRTHTYIFLPVNKTHIHSYIHT